MLRRKSIHKIDDAPFYIDTLTEGRILVQILRRRNLYDEIGGRRNSRIPKNLITAP